MRTRLVAAIAAGAVILAACGGDDATATDGTADGSAGAEVGTASTDHGTVLVDGDGRTLYLFDNDGERQSTCYESCAETWPPLTGGEASARGEVDPALLGTTERDDGTVQVTYAGWPLYLYAGDEAPGDTNGQGVGDVWWIVSPEGERVTGEAAAEPIPADGYDY